MTRRFAPKLGEARVAAMARIGQVVWLDVGRDARGPRAQHDNPPGEEQRLLDIVGDQQGGEARRAATAHELGLHGEARQRVELASGSSRSSSRGSLTSARAKRHALRHAARKLVRIGLGEAVEPDQAQRVVDPCRAAASAARAPPGRARHCSHTVRQGNSVGSWKTRMREGSGPVIVLAVDAAARRASAGRGRRRAAAGWTCRSRSGRAARRTRPARPRKRRGRAPAAAGLELEAMRDVADRRARASRGASAARPRRRRSGYHLTSPFCQDSSRSRTRKSRVIRPEHISAMTSSAAYMLA